jgi:hypothetical protein
MKINILIWLLTVFSVNISGQRYDFSSGDISSIKACERFPVWSAASVDDYPSHPSGSIEGFVLKSPAARSSCILLAQNINLYKDSIFHIEMYSQLASDALTIYVLDDKGETLGDWFFIRNQLGWFATKSKAPTVSVSDTKVYNVSSVQLFNLLDIYPFNNISHLYMLQYSVTFVLSNRLYIYFRYKYNLSIIASKK